MVCVGILRCFCGAILYWGGKVIFFFFHVVFFFLNFEEQCSGAVPVLVRHGKSGL